MRTLRAALRNHRRNAQLLWLTINSSYVILLFFKLVHLITMTMHLLPPWVSTTGKKKGKRRFRNADAARTAREDHERWNQFRESVGAPKPTRRRDFTPYKPPALNYRGRDEHIPSAATTLAPCAKAPEKVYTGTLIKGLAVMHKSNMVPVLNDQEAVELAHMRR